MEPVRPATGVEEFVLAEHQPEYQPLPVAIYRDADTGSPIMVSRWTFTDEERLAIAEGADVFIGQLTFGKLFQPIIVTTGPEHWQV